MNTAISYSTYSTYACGVHRINYLSLLSDLISMSPFWLIWAPLMYYWDITDSTCCLPAVTRGCAPEVGMTHTTNECKSTEVARSKVYFCHCTENYCNTSATYYPHSLLLMSLALLAVAKSCQMLWCSLRCLQVYLYMISSFFYFVPMDAVKGTLR